MNYFEFQKKFPDETDIVNYFIKIRYNNKVICPYCSNEDSVYHRKSENRVKNFVCKECNNDFSVCKGTIFEKSDTDLRKWFYAINLVILNRKGISALQLKKEIDVTYKTAWRMLKQIKIAMKNKDTNKVFESIVEIDETYVGRKFNKDDNDLQKHPLKKTQRNK